MTTVTLSIDLTEDAKPADVQSAVQKLYGKTAAVSLVSGPEDGPDTVCGLELADPVPEGWTPLEAIVAVRCLVDAPDGGLPVALHWSPTENLPSWEADGMLNYVKHRISLCWGSFAIVAAPDDEENEGDPGTDR